MREKSIKLENPGEGYLPEEVNLLCALNGENTRCKCVHTGDVCGFNFCFGQRNLV